MNRASFTTNRFGTRWGGFLMPFLRNGGENMEDIIEIIIYLLIAAIKLTLHVMAILALLKYITA